MKGFRGRVPWVTVALAALFAAALLAPAGSLEYERTRVASGEVWRLLTGQLVHWTPRMAAFDVGMLLGLGIWLERRGDRRLLAAALTLGGGLTALAVHGMSLDLTTYRGSSGVASALFVLAAVRIADTPDPWPRGLAVAALALFLAKAALESLAGWALFAGPLPPGVQVVSLVHLLGGLGGLVGARPGTRRYHGGPGEGLHDPRPAEEEIEEWSSRLSPRYAFSWALQLQRSGPTRLRRRKRLIRSARTSCHPRRSPAWPPSTRGWPSWPSWRAR